MSSNSIIITGGDNALNQVTRYDEEGFVEDLPSLLVGRTDHGCGSFIRSDGNMVSSFQEYSLIPSKKLPGSAYIWWV